MRGKNSVATLSQQLSWPHISEYGLKLPSKEVLQAKLHKAIEEAELRLGVGDE